jgi:hypothetical protein
MTFLPYASLSLMGLDAQTTAPQLLPLQLALFFFFLEIVVLEMFYELTLLNLLGM